MDQDERIRNWRKAMAQGQRLRDEFAAFVRRPDISRIQPF
jgi:hypothetical protein